jgi:hypothetical protein
MELTEAAAILQRFAGADLTRTIAYAETSLEGVGRDTYARVIAECGAENDVLAAAGLLKQVAGQINVVIHALGILLCLPHILEKDEEIEYVSLGAGNTGKPFDLETNLRVAEFKFIKWQGGPESIRQNALFKDYYLLAEYPTTKRKFLYVLGTEYPLKFLNSQRSLLSVLSRHVKLQAQFRAEYGDLYSVVRDYYAAQKDTVLIKDVSQWLPSLVVTENDFEQETT